MSEDSELQRALRSGRRFGELLSAFQSGAEFGDMVTERRDVGQLVVTSNQIVACDPFDMGFGFTPLSRKVPRGKFPVSLSVAHTMRGKRKGEERVAAAMVRFSRSRPTGFRPATAEGMRRSTLLGAGYRGYEVESGTGCFADARAATLVEKACQRAFEEGELDPITSRTLRGLLSKAHAPERSWATMPLDRKSGANLVAFSAGFGDGSYPSWWGYDDERSLVCLVTDYLVLPTLSELVLSTWRGRSWRTLHYEGDRVDKFWRVKVEGRKQTTHFGQVGTPGEKRSKEFATSEAALLGAARKIAKQEQNGYYEVTLTASRMRASKDRRAEKKRKLAESKVRTVKKKAPPPAKKTPAKKTPAMKTPAKKTPAKKTPAKRKVVAPKPRKRRRF